MTHHEFEYLGPYHVDRLIGRGGMGSVYKGVHSKSGETVAIKVIAASIAGQPRFRRRFAAEIDALKRLRHPNIVSLIGYGEEQGLLFYVMEYVAGHSLHELLRSRGRLDWQDAVHIGIETSAALKQAHNLGIIHRDLKPANLMIDSAGKLKLTDFGIAKLFGSTEETVAGAVIGTADYMPPEQAEGKTVTTRSDLYSLGCVLYTMLAGKPPFAGRSVPEVLYAVRYSSLPDLQAYAAEAPPALIELVHELLAKDPLKRPPTALVVGNRLRSVQQALRGKPSLTDEPLPPAAAPATSHTALGQKLTSLDMDDDLAKLAGCDASAAAADNRLNGTGPGTHEQRTLPASDSRLKKPHRTADHNTRESDLSSEHFSDNSETSLHLSAVTNSATAINAQSSRYTQVGEQESNSYTIIGSSGIDRERLDWVRWLSIAALLATLAGSIGFAWWMLQPESANRLYERILAAAESGDDAQLLLVSNDVKEFLNRFASDERAPEVQALADEAELVRRVRLLQRKAARVGGVDELTAVEQGFLDCMQTRSRDFELGQQKLAAFLSVFAIDNLDPSDARIVELAGFAKAAGAVVAVEQEPVAKAQLETMIQSAEKRLTERQLERYYLNLRLLFEDKPWAQDQMARIQSRLDKLQTAEP